MPITPCGYAVGTEIFTPAEIHQMQTSITETINRLARGFLTGRFRPEDTSNAEMVRVWYNEANFERLARAETLARRKGVGIPEIAVAYVLSQPFPTFALVGPQTIEAYKKEVAKAKTIVWNGPMGVFEMEPFAKGTLAVAQAVCDATRKGAISIVGGGDSVAAVEQMDLAGCITHISTGGGASLEFLEGQTLPGVAALNKKS